MIVKDVLGYTFPERTMPWKPHEDVTPHHLVKKGYALVTAYEISEREAKHRGVNGEILFFQKDDSLFKCFDALESAGEERKWQSFCLELVVEYKVPSKHE